MSAMKRTLTVVGLLVASTAAQACDYCGSDQLGQPPVPVGQTFQVAAANPVAQRQYNPPPFDGRVGMIEVHNPSLYPVVVTLWHPDNGQSFSQWTIPGQQTMLLNYEGRPIIVSSNWGIQLGDAGVKPLGSVGVWEKDLNGQAVFKTSVDRFFR